jgi:hypothetical protein
MAIFAVGERTANVSLAKPTSRARSRYSTNFSEQDCFPMDWIERSIATSNEKRDHKRGIVSRLRFQTEVAVLIEKAASTAGETYFSRALQIQH